MADLARLPRAHPSSPSPAPPCERDGENKGPASRKHVPSPGAGMSPTSSGTTRDPRAPHRGAPSGAAPSRRHDGSTTSAGDRRRPPWQHWQHWQAGRGSPCPAPMAQVHLRAALPLAPVRSPLRLGGLSLLRPLAQLAYRPRPRRRPREAARRRRAGRAEPCQCGHGLRRPFLFEGARDNPGRRHRQRGAAGGRGLRRPSRWSWCRGHRAAETDADAPGQAR